MLRFFSAILSAAIGVFGFFGGIFWSLGSLIVEALGRAVGVAPSAPPASDRGESAEIAEEDLSIRAGEDLNVVRRWASVRLIWREFKPPAGRIGEWLSALDINDVVRIAVANGAGTLAAHLSGRLLSPGCRRSAAATRRCGGSHGTGLHAYAAKRPDLPGVARRRTSRMTLSRTSITTSPAGTRRRPDAVRRRRRHFPASSRPGDGRRASGRAPVWRR